MYALCYGCCLCYMFHVSISILYIILQTLAEHWQISLVFMVQRINNFDTGTHMQVNINISLLYFVIKMSIIHLIHHDFTNNPREQIRRLFSGHDTFF